MLPAFRKLTTLKSTKPWSLLGDSRDGIPESSQYSNIFPTSHYRCFRHFVSYSHDHWFMLILNQLVDIVKIVNSDIQYHDVPFSGSVALFILFCTYCTHCCTHYCGFEHSHGFAMSEWFPQVWPGSSLMSSSRSGREAATALSWGAAKDLDILIKTILEKRGEERDLLFIKAIKGAGEMMRHHATWGPERWLLIAWCHPTVLRLFWLILIRSAQRHGKHSQSIQTCSLYKAPIRNHQPR